MKKIAYELGREWAEKSIKNYPPLSQYTIDNFLTWYVLDRKSPLFTLCFQIKKNKELQKEIFNGAKEVLEIVDQIA